MKKKNWTKLLTATTMNYLNFILARAKGELPSPATFVRSFV